MRRLVRYLCLCLAFAIFLSMPSFAAETTESRASSFFFKHTAYIDKISSSKFEVWFDVAALRIMDELGVKTIEIQRSSDQEKWLTMKTYTKSGSPQLICENTAFHSGYVTHYGVSGYYYRALVTYYAKDSSGTGEYDMYSDTIKL